MVIMSSTGEPMVRNQIPTAPSDDRDYLRDAPLAVATAFESPPHRGITGTSRQTGNSQDLHAEQQAHFCTADSPPPRRQRPGISGGHIYYFYFPRFLRSKLTAPSGESPGAHSHVSWPSREHAEEDAWSDMTGAFGTNLD
ncbi:hypothetical protein SKAU_G00394080 [Synaphobranchus kaupii]|uniref:Uncharacterized protein n=1 Tax=Synaphobranchus kaupii TaxID=118154 RepID=A0A9Q1EC64_SYNKA|nr:hypothetical protein SKAU_G00394080 [Synaphobranchus kaupii]